MNDFSSVSLVAKGNSTKTLTQHKWKIRNRSFYKMSNVATFHTSLFLNIKFNSVKDFKNTKNCQNIKLHGV